jgi:hypothetical protein
VISTRNDWERVALFPGSIVGSDLVKADKLGSIGASKLTTNSSIVIPDLDSKGGCTSGEESTSINFQGTELGLTQDSTIVLITISCATVHAQIAREAEKIRKLIRH